MCNVSWQGMLRGAAQACYDKLPTKKTTVKMLVALTALGALSYGGYTYRAQIGAGLAKGWAVAQPKAVDFAARARTVITSTGAIKAYKYGAAALAVLTGGYCAKKAMNTLQGLSKPLIQMNPARRRVVRAIVYAALAGAMVAAYHYRGQIGTGLARGWAVTQPKLAAFASRARTVMTSTGAIKAYKYGAVALAVLTGGYLVAKRKLDDILSGLSPHTDG